MTRTTRRASFYASLITSTLASMQRTDIDPRWVEGYMRCEHSTLDHLSADTFDREVRASVGAVDEGGTEQAEAVARSFGL